MTIEGAIPRRSHSIPLTLEDRFQFVYSNLLRFILFQMLGNYVVFFFFASI